LVLIAKIMNDNSMELELRKLLKAGSMKLCLYPAKINCSDKIAKAHSIQNNRILSKISVAGMVYMPFVGIKNNSHIIDMEKIGRKKASTFAGLCRYHDNKLFKVIDNNDYVIGDKEQEVAFALRSILKELYSKTKAIKILNPLAIMNDETRLFQMGNIKGAEDLKIYLQNFVGNIDKSNFGFLETKTIVLGREYLIAVNSSINPTYDFEGNYISDLMNFRGLPKALFVNVFPQNGKTYVLLSYLKNHSKYFKFLDNQLVYRKENIQRIRLSNLLATNIENIALSPTIWNRMPKNDKNVYLSLFEKTIQFDMGENVSTDIFNKFNLFV
jgi:hypothetical protein